MRVLPGLTSNLNLRKPICNLVLIIICAYRVDAAVAFTLSSLRSTTTKQKELGYSRLHYCVGACFSYSVQTCFSLKTIFATKYRSISETFWRQVNTPKCRSRTHKTMVLRSLKVCAFRSLRLMQPEVLLDIKIVKEKLLYLWPYLK